jgi:hypothetical protein
MDDMMLDEAMDAIFDDLAKKEAEQRGDFIEHLEYFKQHNVAHPDTLENMEEDGFFEMEDCWHLGYVHVQQYHPKGKSSKKRYYKLVETDEKYGEHIYEWQASDNYAVWQTTGMLGDDFSGQLLFPLDDRTWWCVGYSC